MERNPVRDLDRDDRPGVGRQSEPRYLTRDEVERLLSNMSDTFRPIAATCAYAGLRISESLGLCWRDVDFTADTITVGGQLGINGERVPTKTPSSAARSRCSRRSSGNCSPTVRGWHRAIYATSTRTRWCSRPCEAKPQSRRNALRAVHAAGDAAGLNGDDREPVGLHDLRHSFVALAFEAGVPLTQTAALARHANARVTAQIYAGITDDGREQAASRLVNAGFGA